MSESIIRPKLGQRPGLQNLAPEVQAELRQTMDICDAYCETLRKSLALAKFSISSALDQIEAASGPEQHVAVRRFSETTNASLLPFLLGAAKALETDSF
jgi:hypothetical protein